ncbi:MAG TPA: LemA family protein [Acholeplasmataceae bacterium]|nr:LemA family protein [Acholeplasmataceae bacterium]
MELWMILLIALVVIILIIVFWAIGVSNTIKRKQIKVQESESGIDVALTQRFDMLTKMFQATKGYMKHEADTLEKIVKMRQPARSAAIEEKQEFSNEIEKGLQAINVVVEQYPELRATENMKQLQDATMKVENNLQAARRIYNSNVSVYNRYIVVFPNSIISNRMGAEKLSFFEAEDVKRNDVEFNF